MSKRKIGIGTIDINKKFMSEEEASKYAKRLRQYINYICKKNKYQASVITVVSNLKKGVSSLRYIHNGKKGRPRKEIVINDIVANNWYKGNYNTDWHIHVLIVSNPSYALRNCIKEYIDKNWKDISESDNYDKKKVYKKSCNIKIADYFINQSAEIRFLNCNYSGKDDFEYSLKDYYKEYMKLYDNRKKLYLRNKNNQLSEDIFLEKLDKIESKFRLIEKYFYDISREDDLIMQKKFMREVQLHKIAENYEKIKNKNKVQKDFSIHRERMVEDTGF